MPADRAGKFDAIAASLTEQARLYLPDTAMDAGSPGLVQQRIAKALREAFEAGVEASALVCDRELEFWRGEHGAGGLKRAATDIRKLLEKGRGK